MLYLFPYPKKKTNKNKQTKLKKAPQNKQQTQSKTNPKTKQTSQTKILLEKWYSENVSELPKLQEATCQLIFFI